MAFPTTGLLDDFNRADQGPPPSSSWTDKILAADAGGMLVLTNSSSSSSLSGGSDWWNVSLFGPDSECYVTLVSLPPSGKLAEVWARIASPGSSGATDGYVAQAAGAGLGNVDAKLFRCDNDTRTQIGSTDSRLWAAGNKLGIECVGSSITLYRFDGSSWTALVSTTDSTYTAAGNIGYRADGTVAVFDDFSGGGAVPQVVIQANQPARMARVLSYQ